MEQFITYSSFVCYGLIVLATILFLCFYARRLSWWNGYKKPQQRFKNEKLNKLAIIVPARNESKAIGELLTQLRFKLMIRKTLI